jgi:hypothetical protein
MGHNWETIDQWSVEIWFRIEKDDDGYPRSKNWEQLLAWPVLEGDDLFCIESIPFFLKSVSRGDIVRAKIVRHEEVQEGAFFEFGSVVDRGAHNTYRILLHQKHAKDPKFTEEELCKRGLAVETQHEDFLALDVPPSVDQEAIDNYLIAESKSGRWGLQDGYLHTIRRAT